MDSSAHRPACGSGQAGGLSECASASTEAQAEATEQQLWSTKATATWASAKAYIWSTKATATCTSAEAHIWSSTEETPTGTATR